jgi:hypothetical protein
MKEQILGMILPLLLGFGTAVPFYFMWNSVMPLLFGLPMLTFWQALYLIGMIKIALLQPPAARPGFSASDLESLKNQLHEAKNAQAKPKGKY